MKKALIIASVASMIDQFNMPHISLLQEMGYEVHVACNFLKGNTCSPEKVTVLKEELNSQGVVYYHIDFARNVLNVFLNINAYKQIKQILKDNKYDLIHCHSPIGGVVGRLAACSSRKTGTKVIYTAHGFHFYKGAPLRNWLMYYPVEKICARWTDVLITINQEDYALAQEKMKAKRVEYVPGVGIDLQKFGKETVDKGKKRQELGIPEDATILLSVRELNENKNHETVIRAIADMSVYYIIAGKGDPQEYLQSIIDELGMTDRVKLLGYRHDIGELCEAADAFVFPSICEGFSISIKEAMASGLPVVCSRIGENTDLIDENGGTFFDPHSVKECRESIEKLLTSDMERLSSYNVKKIRKFSLELVNEQMSGIIRDGYRHLEILKKRQQKREELGIPLDAMWLLNIGELIPRKNQETLIRAVAGMDNVYLTIAGRGDLMEPLTKLIDEMGVSRNVKLLGYRTDISDLCKSCDIFAFSSFHEGLPVSVMEAMASGLPVVCSRIRGNTDLIDENGGMLFNPNSVENCKRAVEILMDKNLKKFGIYNSDKIKEYEVCNVMKVMKGLYEI